MVKKPSFQKVFKPDVVSPAQLREQARVFSMGKVAGRAKWWQVAAALGLVVVFITVAAFAIIRVMWAAPHLDSSKYQAVFLDDGKVFFGKLRNTHGEYVTLENAYYTRGSQATTDAQKTTDQTALVEVGSESYGPENSLQIARSKIQFWQNLRDDSQITSAINNKTKQ